LLAGLAVLAFIASFVFGIGRRAAERDPAVNTDTLADSVVIPDSRVRVQVLNGSNIPGLAGRATDALREAGFDVVSIGNARTSVTTSLVLDRVGSRAIADSVAGALGIARIETRRDTSLYLEVTVILGPDWRDRPVPARR
jgi:hypothetical protein